MPINHSDTRSIFFPITFILLALAGSILILYSTQLGPWTIEDSIDYIDTANNLVLGNGLVNTRPSGRFEPVHLHPPLYSFALVPAAFFELDMLQAARWMNVVFFAAGILILGFGTMHLTRSRRLAMFSALLFFASTAMLNNYTGAMSEGLYFLLGFTGLLLVAKHLQKPGVWTAILAGLFTGMALFTRFNGVAFVGVGATALLLLGKRDIRHRLADVFAYITLTVFPYLLWIVYLRIKFPWVEPGYYDWQVNDLWEAVAPVRGALVDSAWTWLGLNYLWNDPPYRIELISFAALLLFVAVVTFLSMRKYLQLTNTGLPNHPVFQLGMLWLSFSLASTLVLTFSYVFVSNPKPALYERILSPIQIGFLLAAFAWSEFLAHTWSSQRFSQVIPALLGILLVGTNMPNSLATARDLHENGRGYTSKVWLTSPVLEEVRKLPPGIPLISNQPAPVFFLTGRPAYDMISSLARAGLNTPGVSYGDNLADSNQKLFREDGAALIIFEVGIWDQLHNMSGVSGNITLSELTQGLVEHAHPDDGWIYFYMPGWE